jgi:hypothetical protein
MEVVINTVRRFFFGRKGSDGMKERQIRGSSELERFYGRTSMLMQRGQEGPRSSSRRIS